MRGRFSNARPGVETGVETNYGRTLFETTRAKVKMHKAVPARSTRLASVAQGRQEVTVARS